MNSRLAVMNHFFERFENTSQTVEAYGFAKRGSDRQELGSICGSESSMGLTGLTIKASAGLCSLLGAPGTLHFRPPQLLEGPTPGLMAPSSVPSPKPRMAEPSHIASLRPSSLVPSPSRSPLVLPPLLSRPL